MSLPAIILVALSAAIPAYVPANKRMNDADLAKKKTGVFMTALPSLSADPVNGFGGVVDAFLYANGDREDRLFAYTPYRAKLGLHLQYTTRETARAQLSLDTPYLHESPWRMKLDLKFKNDPNRAFYGLTEASLDPLPAAAAGADPNHYRFKEREFMANAKFDRAIFDGNTRAMMGYELQHLAFETYGPQSRLGLGVASGEALGVGGGVVSIVQSALIHDTRDFEPDPTRGVFLEAANEASGPVIGSQFAFDKVLLQAKTYHRVLADRFPRTVIATRFGLGTIFGDQAPFFEYHDQWTTEGSIPAVGGAQSNRGFKTNRFLARTVGFANLELRHRFAEVDWLGQNLTFGLVPFVDAGAVGDRPFQVRLDQPRVSAGTGLRIGWNRSTIVVADVAVSAEDRQFLLNFNKSY